MPTPRKQAEALAAELHISAKALADAKMQTNKTWPEIVAQLELQIDKANDYSDGYQVDPFDNDEDWPDIFSYYHRD